MTELVIAGYPVILEVRAASVAARMGSYTVQIDPELYRECTDPEAFGDPEGQALRDLVVCAFLAEGIVSREDLI